MPCSQTGNSDRSFTLIRSSLRVAMISIPSWIDRFEKEQQLGTMRTDGLRSNPPTTPVYLLSPSPIQPCQESLTRDANRDDWRCFSSLERVFFPTRYITCRSDQ
ncbi:hypothetical protein AWENTII_012040 [Aspergillus wentii]